MNFPAVSSIDEIMHEAQHGGDDTPPLSGGRLGGGEPRTLPQPLPSREGSLLKRPGGHDRYKMSEYLFSLNIMLEIGS
jgi:hypothetical protein